MPISALITAVSSRITLWVLSLAVSVSLWLLAATVLPLPESARQRLYRKLDRAIEIASSAGSKWATVLVIYLNNMIALLTLSVPVYVLVGYPATLLVNGWIIVLLAERFSASRRIVALSLLMYPHTWLEMLSYSIVACGAITLTLRMVASGITSVDVLEHLMVVALASAVLFVAALLEALVPELLLRYVRNHLPEHMFRHDLTPFDELDNKN